MKLDHKGDILITSIAIEVVFKNKFEIKLLAEYHINVLP